MFEANTSAKWNRTLSNKLNCTATDYTKVNDRSTYFIEIETLDHSALDQAELLSTHSAANRNSAF